MSPKTPMLAGIIETAVRNGNAEVHVMLPGRVEKYDPKTQKVDVQPMIDRYQEGADGETIQETYPVISGVPMAFPRIGKFVITLPVAVGDLVTLKFCESSIETYQLGTGRNPVSPDLFQRFSLTDAVAEPGWYPDGKALQSTDLENMVIGQDGLTAQFIALANLVLGELNDVKADFTAFKTTSESHTHGYIPGTLTPAVTTPPSATPTGTPPTTWPTPHDPQSVAAQRVKAT